LLQDASVLGQSFTTDALAAVTTADTTDLEGRLRGLTRRELLVLRADPRSPDRGQYAFVQSLIREVAYNTLARPDRKSRHLAAARHFESLPTDELAGALAGHYLAAHENAPSGAEADALAAQARIALRRAAERASALASHEQAVRFLRQALSVTTDEHDRADFHQRAGDAANNAGMYQGAIEHYREAAELHRGLGDRPGVLLATAMLARTHLDAYDTDAAMTLTRGAVERDADLAEDPAFVAVEGQLARALFFADEMADAIAVADRVLDKAEHQNLVGLLADTLITKGSAMLTSGRIREALLLIAGGGELALSVDLPTVALRASINRGFAEAIEDPRMALASAREGLALCRRLGLKSVASVLAGNAAEYAVETGDWDWALSEVASIDETEPSHRAIGLSNQVFYSSARGGDASRLIADLEMAADEAGDTSTRGQFLYAKAWDLLLRGRPGEAREVFQQEAATSRVMVGQVTALAARCALWVGDRAGVAADLEYLDQSGEFGRTVEAVRQSLHAGLAALDGKEADAVRMYRESRRTFAELDLPWSLALVGIDMAHCLPLDLPEVAEARTESRRILERLDARALLDQLDQLEERRGTKPAPADRSTDRAATPERA
jgi:tetratricopeptide (TPR) repeat protein